MFGNPQPSSQRPADSGLTVRRFERHQLSLPLQVSLVEPSLVRMSRSSGAGERFNATLVDLGQGGLGLESQWFLPRHTGLLVRLLTSKDSGSLPAFEASVRVMRTRMISRAPLYAIGCSFVEPTPALHQTIEDVLSLNATMRSGEAI